MDITPPHTPLPVFRQIGERTIPYSWRACKQLRHVRRFNCAICVRRLENCVICVRRLNCVICVRRLENCVIRVTVWLLLWWIDGTTTVAREGCGSLCTARVINEGRKVRLGVIGNVLAFIRNRRYPERTFFPTNVKFYHVQVKCSVS
ncbi:hypothetical protein TNCV_4703961 [Trichonephila clavipes]|nr:hypothetical protein TNCV_4703961 [Trichonephila clavipes]